MRERKNASLEIDGRWPNVVYSSLFTIIHHDFSFPNFFVSGPCARLSWPSHQLLRAR